MFISYNFKQKVSGSIKYIYLHDTDFECELTTINNPIINEIITIIKEYEYRELNIALNLALLTKYLLGKQRYSNRIDDFISLQSQYCPGQIKNWDQIAKKRDEYLEILSIIK